MAADTSIIFAVVSHSMWPGPLPRPLGIGHDICAVRSRTVDWTARTPYAKDNEVMFSLLFNSRVHKNNTEPAQVCAPVLLISTKC